MTNEEALKVLDKIPTIGEQVDALEMAIKALEQEPCDDYISRTELLSKIDAERKYLLDLKMDGAEHIIVHHARRIIEELPSVTPQPRKGRWEWVQYDSNSNIGNWHCSECRTIIPHMPEETDNAPIYKWCPMCGVRMEVSDDK